MGRGVAFVINFCTQLWQLQRPFCVHLFMTSQWRHFALFTLFDSMVLKIHVWIIRRKCRNKTLVKTGASDSVSVYVNTSKLINVSSSAGNWRISPRKRTGTEGIKNAEGEITKLYSVCEKLSKFYNVNNAQWIIVYACDLTKQLVIHVSLGSNNLVRQNDLFHAFKLSKNSLLPFF